MLNRQIDELNEITRKKARKIIAERSRGVTRLGAEPKPMFGIKPYTEAESATGELYAWTQLDKADQAHVPTGKLIVRVNRILDPEARARVIGEIRDLRDRYDGTEAEYKAPNGKASLLLEELGEDKGKQAWYAVRTPSFKDWFGDWEKLHKKEMLEGEAVSAIFSKDIPIQNGKGIQEFYNFVEDLNEKYDDSFDLRDDWFCQEVFEAAQQIGKGWKKSKQPLKEADQGGAAQPLEGAAQGRVTQPLPAAIQGRAARSFKDDELAKFIENAPGIVERAGRYETAEEFRKDYDPFESAVEQGNELADTAVKKDFYGILHQASKEGRDPKEVAAEKAEAGEAPQSAAPGEGNAGEAKCWKMKPFKCARTMDFINYLLRPELRKDFDELREMQRRLYETDKALEAIETLRNIRKKTAQAIFRKVD
jgi:hypothetical protein